MRLVLLCVLLSGIINAAGFMIEDNTALAAGALISTIVMTLAVVTWIDKRIEAKLKPLSEQVEELRAAVLGEPRRLPKDRK